MTDENKEPVVEQKKGAEGKTQLSEEALGNITGGGTKQNVAKDTLPTESIKLNYGTMEYAYTQPD
jgi:hypothetical protein